MVGEGGHNTRMRYGKNQEGNEPYGEHAGADHGGMVGPGQQDQDMPTGHAIGGHSGEVQPQAQGTQEC